MGQTTRVTYSYFKGPLTRYAKLRLTHAPPTSKKPLVNDPGMHYGTCVTHVPCCMSGSLTRGGGKNVSGIPGGCATRNFAYLVRGPWRGQFCKFCSLYFSDKPVGCLWNTLTLPGLRWFTQQSISLFYMTYTSRPLLIMSCQIVYFQDIFVYTIYAMYIYIYIYICVCVRGFYVHLFSFCAFIGRRKLIVKVRFFQRHLIYRVKDMVNYLSIRNRAKPRKMHTTNNRPRFQNKLFPWYLHQRLSLRSASILYIVLSV